MTHASTFSQLPASPEIINSTAVSIMPTAQPPTHQYVRSRQRHASTFGFQQCACLQDPISSDGKKLHHQTGSHSAELSGGCTRAPQESFSRKLAAVSVQLAVSHAHGGQRGWEMQSSNYAQSAPCRKSFSLPVLLKVHLRGQQLKNSDPPRLAAPCLKTARKTNLRNRIFFKRASPKTSGDKNWFGQAAGMRGDLLARLENNHIELINLRNCAIWQPCSAGEHDRHNDIIAL